MLKIYALIYKLVTSKHKGSVVPPAAMQGTVVKQKSTTKAGITTHGDFAYLYLQNSQTRLIKIRIDVAVLVRLCLWVVYWFIFRQWCGLRLLLWRWATRKIVQYTIKNEAQNIAA